MRLALFLLAAIPGLAGESTWMTCDWTQDNGSICFRAKPAPFWDFMYYRGGATVKGPFAREFDVTRSTVEQPEIFSLWREVGFLGSVRIREVSYLSAGGILGRVLIAERTPDQYVPLLRSSGDAPKAAIRVEGSRQMLEVKAPLQTWTWIDQQDGPLRIEVKAELAYEIHVP